MNNEVEVVEKKKSILPILLIALVIVSVGAYFLFTKVLNKEDKPKDDPPTKEVEKVTPLMYKITKEGSDNVIYLFGSIHFANIDKMEFPEYLLNAYKNSDYLACEFDINAFLENVDQQELINDYMYSDDTDLSEHVSKETYDKVIKFMKDKYGYSEDIVKIFKASYIENLIIQLILKETNISTSTGIDTHFLTKAKEDKKTILEVESYEFQSELENKVPDKYYDLALSDSIDEFDKGVSDMRELYQAWCNGDEAKINELATEEGETEEENALIEEYNKLLLYDRNIGMANKLKEYFNDNKKVLYMVGAAHLVGDKGIAKLLENDGYKVERVK